MTYTAIPQHELTMKIYSTFGLQKYPQGQIAKSSFKVCRLFLISNKI